MKKYYHMIIERPAKQTNKNTCAGCLSAGVCGDPERVAPCFGREVLPERKEYISTKQGSAPAGWVCVGVCGYHEQ